MTYLLGLSRTTKRSVQVAADLVLLTLSFLTAVWLRLDRVEFLFGEPRVWLALVLVFVPTIALFVVMGFYRAVVRFVSVTAVRTVLIGVLASAVLLLVTIQIMGLPVPRSVSAIYFLLALVSMAGVRLAMRAVYAVSQLPAKAPVIIYGAGNSGRQLLAALQRGPEYDPVAFVDDAKELQGFDVAGLRVHAPGALPALIEKHGATALLLAMPSLKHAERRELLERLKDLSIQVRTVPGSADIVSGKAAMADLREIAIEDLLGRDPVPPEPALMQSRIRGKAVLVTGAGGSIGSELCRQILTAEPETLVLFEQSEYALYAIHEQLMASGTKVRLVPILGSVCDAARVRQTLASFAINTVYHAAAYKHVPMVEMNVVEGLRNNLFGTLTTATAAAEAGVQAFILVSTDKAVRPTNIMGTSKRMAELVCQALARRHPSTVYSIVRFGNVLGSSGSVIPLFRRQIAAGGPITVTHPEITRYFMTIPEAAQLVIQAGAMARGGDVFVLDMGEPVRIADLAERMALLHGLRPVFLPPGTPEGTPIDGDIAIVFSALRPGEKLYEELLIDGAATPTKHPRILTANEVMLEWEELSVLLADLAKACEAADIAEIRRLLIAAGTGFSPVDGISDLVWNEGAAERDGSLQPA